LQGFFVVGYCKSCFFQAFETVATAQNAAFSAKARDDPIGRHSTTPKRRSRFGVV
jgi:hypothetical protein